jgi:hypothetical protein
VLTASKDIKLQVYASSAGIGLTADPVSTGSAEVYTTFEATKVA